MINESVQVYVTFFLLITTYQAGNQIPDQAKICFHLCRLFMWSRHFWLTIMYVTIYFQILNKSIIYYFEKILSTLLQKNQKFISSSFVSLSYSRPLLPPALNVSWGFLVITLFPRKSRSDWPARIYCLGYISGISTPSFSSHLQTRITHSIN